MSVTKSLTGKRISLALGLLLTVFASAFAATWRGIGPTGGSASRFVVDPRNPSVVYAEFGLRAIAKTKDGGCSWRMLDDNPASELLFYNVCVSAESSAILYALKQNPSSGLSEIHKSTDGGGHWSPLPAQPSFEIPMVGGFRHLEADPLRSGILYLADDREVFGSTDDGASWRRIHRISKPAESYATSCEFFIADPSRPGTVFLGIRATDTLGSLPVVQWMDKTEDGGATWSSIVPPITIADLRFDRGDPSSIYARNVKGLFRSGDGGVSWGLLFSPEDGDTVWDVSFGPADSRMLYVGTRRRVYRSTDGGTTWASAWGGLPVREVHAVLVNTNDPSIVLAGATSSGIFRTTDGGASWNFSSSGLKGMTKPIAFAVDPAHSSTLYVSTLGSSINDFFKTTDRGSTWTWLGRGLPAYGAILALAVHPGNSSILYAAQAYGVLKSLDGGVTWTEILHWHLSNPPFEGTDLAIDPVHPDTVYAGSYGSFYKTVNGGANWTSLEAPFGDHDVYSLVIDPANPATIYTGLRLRLWGSPGTTVFKSTDGGATWAGIIIKSGAVWNYVALAIRSDDTRVLFAATPDGLYRSADAGGTWTQVLASPSDGRFESVAVAASNPSVVYATNGGRCFRSSDGGNTWDEISSGLVGAYNHARVVVDPADSAQAYLYGQYYNGIMALGGGSPRLAVDRTFLSYGAAAGVPATKAQPFLVSNAGEGNLSWTAASDQPWILVSPSGGHNNGVVRVSVDATGLAPGTYIGSVTVEDPQAADSPQAVAVRLSVYGAGGDGGPGSSGVPFGHFDTPTDQAAIEGSVAVTGWALDDIQVAKVEIWRETVPSEGNGLVYIGDAVFVEGARPDVEAAYPLYPLNRRAGWGYMMLTNFLPAGGNGTFVLHARAIDVEGRLVDLGTKSIVCDNAGAVMPFGAIDTPGQGEEISGSLYYNFGWALTPLPNSIPTDGSTIWVWVDSLPLARPSYNHYRADIATLFPGYANSNAAVGVYELNTTAFTNGVHTIAWSVVDNAGNEDGIGSRYFSILNAGTPSPQGEQAAAANHAVASGAAARSFTRLGELGEFRDVSMNSINARRGFNRSLPPESVIPKPGEATLLATRELERVEILLDDHALKADVDRRTSERAGITSVSTRTPRYEGYLIVEDELRPLPIGSTLDDSMGIFSWLPGPGFLGDYRLAFIDRENKSRSFLTIRIEPRYSKNEK